mmetsp:Transcript_78407/g.209506  ORF Transcript_78407/g.209506 Transcript_78407/m.209506 type:complete len:207 (-) Transcript_78407:819-1439(-)
MPQCAKAGIVCVSATAGPGAAWPFAPATLASPSISALQATVLLRRGLEDILVPSHRLRRHQQLLVLSHSPAGSLERLQRPTTLIQSPRDHQHRSDPPVPGTARRMHVPEWTRWRGEVLRHVGRTAAHSAPTQTLATSRRPKGSSRWWCPATSPPTLADWSLRLPRRQRPSTRSPPSNACGCAKPIVSTKNRPPQLRLLRTELRGCG